MWTRGIKRRAQTLWWRQGTGRNKCFRGILVGLYERGVLIKVTGCVWCANCRWYGWYMRFLGHSEEEEDSHVLGLVAK